MRIPAMRGLVARPVVWILMLGALSALAWSQVSASITGRVMDAAGMPLPGASVTVKTLDTGATRSVVTDDGGRFRVLALPVGQQEVKVEKNGFKAAVRS